MIEPQYKKDGKYVCDDYAGYCFVMIPNVDKDEILKQQAISNAESTARYLIKKLALGILL